MLLKCADTCFVYACHGRLSLPISSQDDPCTRFPQGSGQLGMPAAVALAQALASALLMNVCIVGLNQLYDVEIDKVNKPYLPLASGEMTMRQVQMPLLQHALTLICTRA